MLEDRFTPGVPILVEYGAGRPDKASYDKEQETIKSGIVGYGVGGINVRGHYL